jgi:hypothetical protein
VRLSHGFGCHFGVRIGSVAARKQTLLTEPALTAADSEWNDDAITDLLVRDFGAKFDHLATTQHPPPPASFEAGSATGQPIGGKIARQNTWEARANGRNT